MRQGKLYTVGYATLDGVGQLERFLAHEILLIDIRYLPASRWKPEWSRKRLNQQFAPNYQHVRELGNINYSSLELPIQLFKAEQGVPKVVSLLKQGCDVCLLCVCVDWQTCHRKVVADLIQRELSTLEVIHLSKEKLYSLEETPLFR